MSSVRSDTDPPTREAVELGFMLKQIKGYEFSMAEFDSRLKLQKMVYLLQAFGVYLGYDFSWYLRGPHCLVLTSNGLRLQEIYASIPEQKVRFSNKKSQKLFKKFLKFVKGKSTDDLEIAASLHCLSQACRMSGSEAKSRVENRRGFSPERVDDAWTEMEKCGLIPDHTSARDSSV